MKLPVISDVAVVVSLLSVLAVEKVSDVGVVVLSLMHTHTYTHTHTHTHTHHVRYFRRIVVLFLRYNVILSPFLPAAVMFLI